MKTLDFPQEGDHPKYFDKYLNYVKGQEFLGLMNKQVKEIEKLFESKDEAWAVSGYAKGKWSPKEVLGHITDSERIFAYRALSISRGEKADLPGYDQDPYVQGAGFNSLDSKDLLSDFKINRIAILSLLRTLDEKSLRQKGKANGSDIIVNSLFWIIPAHFAHHFQVLKEKY
ncbi:DinB family protein [Algoriphagus sediminis]|uniref:DinB family protein n=1 Tax=Algoriphagus sediminis TaxID=3057113 RepID=A0ABT7YAW3_9BACT|nr:DinB family protein [Algoriphagus sediminis]MDN3203648.1 DinB family protein [Algoriphagus sediminis]